MHHSLLVLLLSASMSFMPGDGPRMEPAAYQSEPEIMVIPFTRSQNLILIEASVDTIAGNFVLDTGAPGLILNKTYFRDSWIADGYEVASAVGTTSAAHKTRIRNFRLHDLYLEKTYAQLSELGHIENQRGVKILGLLGVELFKDYEMRIDFHKKVLYLAKPGAKWKGNKKPLHRLPFHLSNNSIMIEAVVNQKTLNFCFDTGAEVGVISNLVPKKVLESFTVRKRITVLGTGSAQREVLLGSIDKIAFGQLEISNMSAIIAKLDGLGESYGRSLHGMIGYNLLTKGIISINFATQELCIYPFADTDK